MIGVNLVVIREMSVNFAVKLSNNVGPPHCKHLSHKRDADGQSVTGYKLNRRICDHSIWQYQG